MNTRHSTKRDSTGLGTDLQLIIIICFSITAIIILVAMLALLRLLQRRRRAKADFQQACLHDPTMTWEDYEIQRSIMIRKSTQSRASDRPQDDAHPRPHRRRSRSRNWQQQQQHGSGMAETGAAADWRSAEASVERSWQLYHGGGGGGGGGPPRSCPGNNGPFWSEEDDDAPQRPPTVRLRTPPLLSHPLFRDGGEQCRPKHTSLPMELTRARNAAVVPTGDAV